MMKNFITLLIILIGLYACVNSKEATQQFRDNQEFAARNPHPHYNENIGYYFRICEKAIYEGALPHEELINRGFRVSKGFHGTNFYKLPIGIAIDGLGIRFTSEKDRWDPNTCIINFNNSIFLTKYVNAQTVFGVFRKAANNAGYQSQAFRFLIKGERKIEVVGRLSQKHAGGSYSLILKLKKS